MLNFWKKNLNNIVWPCIKNDRNPRNNLEIKVHGKPRRKLKNELERGIHDDVERIGWKKEENGLTKD